MYAFVSLCLAEVNEKLKEIREDIQNLTEVMGEVRQKEIFKVNFTLDYFSNVFYVITMLTQKLLDSLPPDVKQELRDNVWLKREVHA